MQSKDRLTDRRLGFPVVSSRCCTGPCARGLPQCTACFDEPASSLDPTTHRKKIEELIRSLA